MKKTLIISIIFIIFINNNAFAYLDPGTGSILLQGLIGGVAITMSFLSIYWQKVKAFFVKKELDSDTEEDIGNND